MGGGGRYVPGRLRVVEVDRVPSVLWRECGPGPCAVSDADGSLFGGLRSGQCASFLGARRVFVSRDEGLPAHGSTLHDPVSLVLPGAPGRGIPAPDERA